MSPVDYAALIRPAVCDCGETVHAEAARDEWMWVDAAGRRIVDTAPAGYREDPRLWWETLAATDIAAYSALLCRADLGMLPLAHIHRPAFCRPFAGDVPVCCEMPMRLTPQGWVCRERCSPAVREGPDTLAHASCATEAAPQFDTQKKK
jgi:hypothetical protein